MGGGLTDVFVGRPKGGGVAGAGGGGGQVFVPRRRRWGDADGGAGAGVAALAAGAAGDGSAEGLHLFPRCTGLVDLALESAQVPVRVWVGVVLESLVTQRLMCARPTIFKAGFGMCRGKRYGVSNVTG